MEAQNEQAGAKPTGKFRTPPYIAYKTLQTLFNELKTNGLPPQIDRSVLTRFAGGIQGQIMLALRSLDLIDGENKPKPKLAALVAAYDTPQFKGELRPIIEATYPYVFKLDLMNATPTMFADAFKDATDAKEDVLRKCRTFFLNAARDLGIPLGSRIEKASFPRARPNGGATKRSKPVKPAKPEMDAADVLEKDPQENAGLVTALLAKFPEFDPKWPADIQKQWFEGFERFMSGAGINKKSGS